MSVKKRAITAVLAVSASLGLTGATLAVTPLAAQASDSVTVGCSTTYGNSILSGEFTIYARSVSVDWYVHAAGGSGAKRASMKAWNNVETSTTVYGNWVSEGQGGNGTLSTPESSQLRGGYGSAALFLVNDRGLIVQGLRVDRSGSCGAGIP